ncbi:MAG: flavodoxin domain-containing protein, partial [Bradymonadaceae bacterium]
DLGTYDGLVIGASVHVGKHQKHMAEFVRKHQQVLNEKPSAFFTVSLSSADDHPESKKSAREAVDKFTEETGWKPDMIALFAGALRYTHYGFIKRTFMRHLMKKKGSHDLDSSKDYVYTDWEEVDDFARVFRQSLDWPLEGLDVELPPSSPA